MSVQWDTLPTEPYSEVVGGLFVGSTSVAVKDQRFEAILTLTETGNWAHPLVEELRWHWSVNDELLPEDELRFLIRWAHDQWHERGRSLLIRCGTGLNRSGLIAAATLMQTGMSMDKAVDAVIRGRSPYALVNPRYIDFLRGLA